MNQQLYAYTSAEKFATFYFGIYDGATGRLTYTNAGHPPPILIRDGTVLRLETNGMVVGAFPFAEYGESRIELMPGDLLVCFTDGITEPENEYGEMFGEERLIELLVKTLLAQAGRDHRHHVWKRCGSGPLAGGAGRHDAAGRPEAVSGYAPNPSRT